MFRHHIDEYVSAHVAPFPMKQLQNQGTRRQRLTLALVLSKISLKIRLGSPEWTKLASIRVVDDGAPPIVEKGRETPFKQGEYYVFDVEDDIARYWNKLAPAKRAELSKQSRKVNKDLRVILDPFVHKPRTMK